MNIFQRVNRQEALSKIEITDPDMLKTYRWLKSVELHITGKYDITMYSKLENLTETSFSKESNDMKLSVRALSTLDVPSGISLWIIRASALVIMDYLLNGKPRASAVRELMYSQDKLTDYNYLLGFQGKSVYDAPPKEEMLFGYENLVTKNYLSLCRWLESANSTDLINREFFSDAEKKTIN